MRNIFLLRKSLRVKHFVTLKTGYDSFSDKFCASSVLNMFWHLTEGFVLFSQVPRLGSFT